METKIQNRTRKEWNEIEVIRKKEWREMWLKIFQDYNSKSHEELEA